MDNISEERLLVISPELAVKIHSLATMLEQEGIYIRVVQGLRTWTEQDILYAQGRSLPGIKVTNCPGGYSYHNFGLAVDCVPSQFDSKQPYNPDWNSSHSVWKNMESKGKVLGLGVGAYWRSFPDAPHFQLHGRFPEGAPSNEVRQIFTLKGLTEVWKESGIIT